MQQKFLVESEEGLSELGIFRQKINFCYPCEITVEGKIGPHSRYDIALKRKPKIIRIRSLGLIEFEDMRFLSLAARAGTGVDPSDPIMKGRVIETTNPATWSSTYGDSGFNYRQERRSAQKKNWDFNPKKKSRGNPFL